MPTTHQILKKMDVFGSTFNFEAQKGSTTYKSSAGGCLTILGTIIVLLMTYSFMQDWIDTSSPVVSVNIIQNKRPPRLNLSEFDIGQTFILFDGSDFVRYNNTKKYFTLRAEMKTSTISKTSERELDSSSEKIDTLRCEDATEPIIKRLYNVGMDDTTTTINYREIFADKSQCPHTKEEQWWVEGSNFELPFRRNVVKLYPCSLPDPTQCASIDSLSNALLVPVILIKTASYNKKKSP